MNIGWLLFLKTSWEVVKYSHILLILIKSTSETVCYCEDDVSAVFNVNFPLGGGVLVEILICVKCL